MNVQTHTKSSGYRDVASGYRDVVRPVAKTDLIGLRVVDIQILYRERDFLGQHHASFIQTGHNRRYREVTGRKTARLSHLVGIPEPQAGAVIKTRIAAHLGKGQPVDVPVTAIIPMSPGMKDRSF